MFNYKHFLENLLDYEIPNESIIFFNHFNKKPYTDTTLRKHFDFYCKKAGVPIIRLYDLRHTFATNLVAEGIPVPYVQEMLGHTSYNTTVKNYVHTRKDIKITTSEMADKLLQR